MKIVVELDNYSLKYDNVLAIMRVLANENTVNMWNANVTPFIDMMDELQPDIVFYHSEVNPRVISKLAAERKVLLVDTVEFENRVVADEVAFKKQTPHKMFACDELCIIQYPEVENTDLINFMKKISPVYRKSFRIFSIKPMSTAKNCGWIPKELHPLLFSSAQSVLCLSLNTAFNAHLCNDNVVIVTEEAELAFKPSPEDIKKVLSSTIAKEYIDRYATI